ncbi:MAG: hypothetical protein LC722_07870, partial [Actinobacteria bacterium]|nr:hypothetical protein [Actinomycetota bacterium]
LNEGLSITQFWGGAVNGDGTVLIGGTQDNGTYVRAAGGGPNDWRLVLGGDGMLVAVAPDASAYYAENPGIDGLAISRSTTGEPGSFRPSVQGIVDKGLFVAAYEMDPSDPLTLWAGGSKLWRTTNGGDLWIESSPLLEQPGFESGVSAIGVAPGNSDIVYAGTSSGRVWVTASGRGTPPAWTEVTGLLPTGPNGRVSSIAVDPSNPDVAYLTHTFFGVPHVWKTTDRGGTWTSIDGNLPDVPVSTVAVNPRNPQMVFIGTDIGVFESPNGGATWHPSGSNVPGIYVMELFFRAGTSELYAFTHGRGAYMVDVGA